MKRVLILWIVTIGAVLSPYSQTWAQYEKNPLQGKKWLTLSSGLNNADMLSWQVAGALSMRGENALTEIKLSYSQELSKSAEDSCTGNYNNLSEVALIWGDGWGGKSWFASGGVGFGLNVRMFCRRGEYEDEYITAVTVGVPLQIEAGLKFGKRSAISIIANGNLNFREAYFGAALGYVRFFK